MATGDDALAAGMAIMTGTEAANTLDTEVNLTRDYIAQRTSVTLPIAKGGTGSTTASAARSALGITPGNVGAVEQAGASIKIRWDSGSLNYVLSINGTETSPLCRHDQVPGLTSGKRDLTNGDFGSGTPIYTPHGRANPVTTSYVAAYLNNDGRLGATPSARRFKKNIKRKTYTLEDLARLGALVVTYQLRAALYGDADAPVEHGVIAEELIDAGFPEFVAFGEDGEPFSVHYERLVLVVLGAMPDLINRVLTLEAASA